MRSEHCIFPEYIYKFIFWDVARVFNKPHEFEMHQFIKLTITEMYLGQAALASAITLNQETLHELHQLQVAQTLNLVVQANCRLRMVYKRPGLDFEQCSRLLVERVDSPTQKVGAVVSLHRRIVEDKRGCILFIHFVENRLLEFVAPSARYKQIQFESIGFAFLIIFSISNFNKHSCFDTQFE